MAQVELQKYLPSDPADFQAFGEDCALTPEHADIGAGGDNGANSGTAYLYALPVGTPSCTAQPNSPGVPSILRGGGSEVAVENDLVLRASDLPANQLGYLLNSLNPGSTPVGSGTLCLGNGIGRHISQVASSVPLGLIDTPVDLGNLPRPTGGGTAVMAGETWYFQLWLRDGTSS